MNSKLRLTLLLLSIFPLLALSAEQMRLFTDAKGRSLRAAFVSAQNGQVTLRLENGQQHSYGDISPGRDHLMITYEGHVWLITDEFDVPPAILKVSAASPVVCIDGPGGGASDVK